MWSPVVLSFLFVGSAMALPAPQSRIVGGEATDISKRPYQASLQMGVLGAYTHSCGASIISTKFLLTAAHCNPGIAIIALYARVGATTYNSGGQLLKVASFEAHPDYDSRYIDYDFAIVGFPIGKTITLGDNVKLIPLASGSDPVDGSSVTVSGWGTVDEVVVQPSKVLREVNLSVFNQDKCRTIYSFVTPRQICLGGTPQGGTSACFGDSGGPAVQNGVQYALVSGGNSCKAPGVPGLYARISAVRPWIKSLTGV